MVNFWPQRGASGALLIVVALVLLVAFLQMRRGLRIRKIKTRPLTLIDAFHTSEPKNYPGASGRPRLTRVGWGLMILSFVMGIIAAGLTYVTLRKFEVDDRFSKEAQTTTAAVLNTSNVPGGGNPSQRGHMVQYQFQVNGQTYQGSAEVPKLRSLKNARRSKEIDVSYLPSNPAVNRPAEEKNLPIVVGLIPLTLLSLFFVVFVRQLRRDFVLAGVGRLTTGVVVGTVSYTHSASVYYDFPNDRGGVTRGHSWLQFPSSRNVYSGSTAQVLYLPGDPEQNVLKLSSCWQT
jgi:hypothetical protein